jgi:leader peptidase (prepilin peptidase)/N-methyltransferase
MYVAGLMGLLLGWPSGIVAMMGSFVLGAMVGVFLIVTRLRTRKQTVPFVPFMVAGIVVALLWGDLIIGFLG